MTPTATAAVSAATPVACCAPLAAPALSDTQAAATADLFTALADPHRVRIANLLATSPNPVCVCELVAPLGLSQPTDSHHLRKLTHAGLLVRERRGPWAFYHLDRQALARLAATTTLDIAGAHLERSAHLPMLEEPAAYADALLGLFPPAEAATVHRVPDGHRRAARG